MNPRPRKIDTVKLRRFIAERNRRWHAATEATDALLEVKGQMRALAERIATIEHRNQEPSPNDVRRLDALKEQVADMDKERAEASRRFREMGFVDEAIAYARSLHYSVDTTLAVINPPPVPDKRKFAPTADDMGRPAPSPYLTAINGSRPGSQNNGGSVDA